MTFSILQVIVTFPNKIRKRYILNDIFIKFITGFSRLHSFFHHIFLSIFRFFSQFWILLHVYFILIILWLFFYEWFLLKSDLWKYYTYYIYMIDVQKILELKNKQKIPFTIFLTQSIFRLFASFVTANELIRFFGKFWKIFFDFFLSGWVMGHKWFLEAFSGIFAIFGY